VFEVQIPWSWERRTMINPTAASNTRRHISDCGLIEGYWGTLETGSFFGFSLSGEFSSWLLERCPSWATIEEHHRHPDHRNAFVGVVLGFKDAKDATLVKLTWC